VTKNSLKNSSLNFEELSVTRKGTTEDFSKKHSCSKKEEEKEKTAAIEKIHVK